MILKTYLSIEELKVTQFIALRLIAKCFNFTKTLMSKQAKFKEQKLILLEPSVEILYINK